MSLRINPSHFKTAMLAAACIAGAAASMTHCRADDLFSEVTTESVFVDGEPATAAEKSKRSATGRVAGASSLIKLLEAMDFNPKRLNTRAVSLNVKAGEWTIPTRLAVAIDEGRVEIALLLSKIDDESKLSATKLLELMNLSRNPSSAVFAYNAEQSRIELRRFVSNSNLTAADLKSHLDELSEIASSSQESWNIGSRVDEKTVASKPITQEVAPTTKATTPQPPAAVNVQGTWSARRGDDQAFALKIEADKTFVLAVISKSKSTRSTGTVTIDGTKMTLVGSDGVKISGQVSNATAAGFEFKIDGQSGSGPLAFKKAS